MGVTIRRASAADVPALAEVAAATFALACPPDMTQDRIDRFVAEVLSQECFERYLADPARMLLLAEDDEGALGYTMLVAGEPHDEDVAAAIRHRPTVELSKIYVLPRAHGTGAAHALMEQSLAWARDTGAAGVWLGVNQQNERAQRFYVKSGFAVAGTKRFLVGGRHEDDYVMEQRLPLA
ncbi:acetyltransferase [Intrasporangium oryzae NRRL B-24470]|uniref:Acetyltransferase n=1 Tax=Intrasporangium oryzae NRRL B-24470 TaxID=1386089 RepID=W9G5C7_9MICO|nr:GNAT family N-acetyltransferase [Intrasporangium oryzae]EWT00497.1 acetyltransferase [Intrasporangium oryzae NRRL B-24470]